MMANSALGAVISDLLSYTVKLGMIALYALVEMASLVHLAFLILSQ